MLLNFLFPKKCLSCGKLGKYICSDCGVFLLRNEQLICPVCRKNSFDGATHKKCEGRYSLDGFFCFWQYKGLVRHLIKNLKYRLVKDEVEEVGSLLIERLRFGKKDEHFLTFLRFLQTKPIIVAVPLHKFRENWRGFNQAGLLGRELARRLGLKFSDRVLLRVKDIRPQVELKGKAREKNIKGIFDLNLRIKNKGKVLSGRTFLLIDDVWTTGSTLRECGKVLKRAGAGKVWALTLAR